MLLKYGLKTKKYKQNKRFFKLNTFQHEILLKI